MEQSLRHCSCATIKSMLVLVVKQAFNEFFEENQTPTNGYGSGSSGVGGTVMAQVMGCGCQHNNHSQRHSNYCR